MSFSTLLCVVMLPVLVSNSLPHSKVGTHKEQQNSYIAFGKKHTLIGTVPQFLIYFTLLAGDLKESGENNGETVKVHRSSSFFTWLFVLCTFACFRQQALLSLAPQLAVSMLVAEAVCASNNNLFKARLLSSTLLMTGVTTIFMSLFGIRSVLLITSVTTICMLPLFQGASAEYVVPLLIIGALDASGSFCSGSYSPSAKGAASNGTMGNVSTDIPDYDMDLILSNVRALQGSLMAAGIIQALIGFTGLVGFILRFVGPVTIVPAMVLIGVYITQPVVMFVEVHWGIAIMTTGVAAILFLYLASHDMPILIWTPSQGFRVIRYPLHQVFAILISILFGWMVCGILTRLGVFTDDPEHIEYNARTDARSYVVKETQWIYYPYPGQYGPISFSMPGFVSCLIATMLMILDSIGDYYACARICRVPAPPSHAVNRGIGVEGLCSFISGTIGVGHATGTYGGNIGAIGVTRVASRQVFITVGIIYVIFGIIGKVCAAFITIPYPVLGGALITMFGIFMGVILSNLQVMDMSSSRNLAIVGLSIFIGYMIPNWIKDRKGGIKTGNPTADNLLVMILGNPNLAGSLLACFLDNTVPGTAEERGIAAWQVKEEDETATLDPQYEEGYEVYRPILPKAFFRLKILKYIPFLPNPIRNTAGNSYKV